MELKIFTQVFSLCAVYQISYGHLPTNFHASKDNHIVAPPIEIVDHGHGNRGHGNVIEVHDNVNFPASNHGHVNSLLGNSHDNGNGIYEHSVVSISHGTDHGNHGKDLTSSHGSGNLGSNIPIIVKGHQENSHLPISHDKNHKNELLEIPHGNGNHRNNQGSNGHKRSDGVAQPNSIAVQRQTKNAVIMNRQSNRIRDLLGSSIGDGDFGDKMDIFEERFDSYDEIHDSREKDDQNDDDFEFKFWLGKKCEKQEDCMSCGSKGYGFCYMSTRCLCFNAHGKRKFLE